MKGAPRSKEFDDVYFSAEDGLAETRHVFLDGNRLPEAWCGHDEFTVGETGFGTGLNFLATWKLFEEKAKPEQKLHFISVEKFPLFPDEIDAAISHWEALDSYRKRLIDLYPKYPKGRLHCMIDDRVTLEVYFEDVVDGLKTCDQRIDAWFLDGFRPSTNPEMWADDVFEQVGRLSKEGTTFSTFTSAGFVRRGLGAVGFDVKKVPGFGRKREMSVGVFR